MRSQKVYDVIGIGIGPFNLGLAALSHDISELSCIFFDKQNEFNWHGGMLLDNARLQVPFLADLVTLANPCSRFSYLNYVHSKGRIIPFGIHEQYYILRKEYNDYCKWVVSQVPKLRFGCACESVRFLKSKKIYEVLIKENSSESTLKFYAKHVVVGVGTVPAIPAFAMNLGSENVIHSSNYLISREKLLAKRSIAIIGSGQSAAEIFNDLLENEQKFSSLCWFTRSERFYPMDFSKLTVEMTSPDYIDYFYKLPKHKKSKILASQEVLYKGINYSLIAEIYDRLYTLNLSGRKNHINIYPACALKNIRKINNDAFLLKFEHVEMEREFQHETEAIVLATGYKYVFPEFLRYVKERICFNRDGSYDVNENYSIDLDNSIFVQNAELDTHGFNAADLGMGPHRNAVILNSILEKEFYQIQKNTSFQTFGLPS